jgi:hypothetical protein
MSDGSLLMLAAVLAIAALAVSSGLPEIRRARRTKRKRFVAFVRPHKGSRRMQPPDHDETSAI